ncbi:MAG: class I SAM-dependent methyltransferase [Maribacter sp.]|nr:class I SAM-dependent methyltransferase [Maribacter sp.]
MKSYLKTKDYSISGEEFELVYDESLDMLVTRPQPQELDKYYLGENYISHSDASKTLIDKMYQTIKKYSLWKKVQLINKYCLEEKTLLDVGAGTGDFLLKAKNRNWKVEGVEPNREAKMRAKEKGIDLYSGLGTLVDRKYNVITLWHVLEHLPNLDNQIKQLVSLLNENGTLIIAVPNFKSFDAQYYQKYWAAYDVPRHLWHFSKRTIEKLFSGHKMKVVKTKPMVFDAFYVSLLSEKYKTGRQNYFRAFVIGFLSNLKGLRKKEFSSHIYILKRS